ncbi:acetolactate synthase small subunit [Alkaliphilus crotonatoxidans]
MEKHVLSVLVENQSGVLRRVAGLFSRRGYNIDSLSVGETENPAFSRMTIVTRGDDEFLDQLRKQLAKLVEVVKIIDLKPAQSVYRELILVKVRATDAERSSVKEIVEIFRGKIIDVSTQTMTLELTGDPEKTTAFVALMKGYGIEEMVTTGLTALGRFGATES